MVEKKKKHSTSFLYPGVTNGYIMFEAAERLNSQVIVESEKLHSGKTAELISVCCSG